MRNIYILYIIYIYIYLFCDLECDNLTSILTTVFYQKKVRKT